MKYKNYYEILNVNRKSSREEIKLSYRKLAKKYHPDMNKSAESEAMFKDINEAYDILTTDEKRKKYDKQVAKLGYGMIESDSSLSNVKYELRSGQNIINGILNTILGLKKDDISSDNPNIKSKDDKKSRVKPEKGKDIISNIEVTLEEGFFGAEKKLAIKSYKTGINTFKINIPIGIQNGDCIRLAALGNPGKNGGKNGDLIIHVKLLQDDEYKLDGINMTKNITISPALAIIGGKYKLKVFDETLFILIPKHIKSSDIIKVEKKGYISEDGERGDLLLKVQIDIPNEISANEEKLYKQILKIEQNKKI